MWINLPRSDKMCPPAYQDMKNDVIPVIQINDQIKAKIIAGKCNGVDAVCQTRIPCQYVDFMVNPSAPSAP